MTRTQGGLAFGLTTLLLVAGCADAGAGTEGMKALADGGAEDPNKVRAGHVVGIVVDPELFPIAEVVVSVTPSDQFVQTDAAGAFDIGPLEPGKYLVLAEKRGYRSSMINVTVTEDDGLRVTITLQPMGSDVPYHESIPRKMYIICSFAIRVTTTPPVQPLVLTAPCMGLIDILVQTATGQRRTNTFDNWTFDFKIEKPGFKSLLMEMTWPEQQFGKNGILQLSTLATAQAGTGVTVGGTVYGGQRGQPYRDIIHAGNSYWVSQGKNVTFYPEANQTQAFQMLVAGGNGNTTVPQGGSALFINWTPTVWLSFFYNRQGSLEFTALADK